MSVNAKLIAALSGIAPTAPGVYTGDEPKYIVFAYTLTGAMYADNVPQCLQYLIQVHYFCPRARTASRIRERIMQSLYEAGFSWPAEETQPTAADNITCTTAHIWRD